MNDWKGLKEFYSNKKVLITGHSGFKGSWLAQTLIQLGSIVKGISLLPERPLSLYHKLELEKSCSSIILDIRKRDEFQAEIISFKPDT